MAASLAAMLAAAPTANAAGCRADAISSRFVEAHRLCRADAPADPATAAVPLPVQDRRSVAITSASRPSATSGHVQPVPVELADRRSVSVSMPGYRQRVIAATNDLRRTQAVRGSGAPASVALVHAVARRYRINPRLLASMMHTESRGNARAVSNKGALGLMQVMPGTARSLGIAQPRAMLGNPVLAMSAGAAYLKKLQRQFGNNVPLVVAAYNAGPGAVERARRRIPRYRETQGYVRQVMGGFAPGRR